MSSDDVAIRVAGVSKHYLIYRRPQDRLKQMLVPRLQQAVGRPPSQYFRDFAALKGVSFEVPRGQTVGIVGRNGCGKSTLLQIICGTMQPSAGSVAVNGRVAALLELGAGFNPDFTGRENVYVNAAILGVTRSEIDDRFEQIASFADIGEFIDQPVVTYSSGMYVRLAFAIAINVDPDILVIDEALAVGDEAFQRKCFARIQQIQDAGGTILFVSHSMQSVVQLCNRAILLDRGEAILEGSPKVVTKQYQRFVNWTGPDSEAVRAEIQAMEGWADTGQGSGTPATGGADRGGAFSVDLDPTVFADLEDDSWFDATLVPETRVDYESRGARIRDARIVNSKGETVNSIVSGQTYAYEYCAEFDQDAEKVGFGMGVLTMNGFSFGGTNSYELSERKIPQVKAGETYQVRFGFDCILLPGTYILNSGIRGRKNGEEVDLARAMDAVMFRVVPRQAGTSGGHIDFRMDLSVERLDT